MADIFVSYARSDRARIEQLADTLHDAGYSTWWDRQILGGDDFSANIERELTAAKAVVVAWSEAGSRSHWRNKHETGAAPRARSVGATS